MVLSVKGPTFGVGSDDDVRAMGLSPVSGYARHVGTDEGSLSSSATPTRPPKQNQRRKREIKVQRENVCGSPLRHPFVKMPGILCSRGRAQ